MHFQLQLRSTFFGGKVTLRPGIRRVVVMSTRPGLGLLQEFVAGAGRQLLALRGPAARPAALRRVAVRQLATAA